MKIKRSRQGFTLIEIVLVLALAGLLLISVFFAVAGAQRARRDHQRKQDMSVVAAAVMAYAANNGGNVPVNQAEADTVFNNYLNNNKVHDPLTGTYVFQFRSLHSSHSDQPPVGTIFYQQAHWCSSSPGAVPDAPGDPIAGDDTQPKRFVVWTGLEAAGGNAGDTTGVWACADNL
jgi:prepilin-type N-terminal cleavage/methylation domain-containing protein